MTTIQDSTKRFNDKRRVPHYPMKSKHYGLRIEALLKEGPTVRDFRYLVYALECKHLDRMTHLGISRREGKTTYGLCGACARSKVAKKALEEIGQKAKFLPVDRRETPRRVRPELVFHYKMMEYWSPTSGSYSEKYRYAR